jgi:hypothetical protein
MLEEEREGAALAHATLPRRQGEFVASHPRRSRLQALLDEPFIVAAPHALQTFHEAHRAEISPSWGHSETLAQASVVLRSRRMRLGRIGSGLSNVVQPVRLFDPSSSASLPRVTQPIRSST